MYYFCQMKITLLAVGKTTSKELEVLIEDYVKRIGHFVKFEIKFIPNQKLSKNLSENEVKTAEGVKILEILKSFESAVLLDDAGETLRSVDFASDLQRQFNHSQKKHMLHYWRSLWVFGCRLQNCTKTALAIQNDTFPPDGALVIRGAIVPGIGHHQPPTLSPRIISMNLVLEFHGDCGCFVL